MIFRNIIRRLRRFHPGHNLNSIVYGPPQGLYEPNDDMDEDEEYSEDDNDTEDTDTTK